MNWDEVYTKLIEEEFGNQTEAKNMTHYTLSTLGNAIIAIRSSKSSFLSSAKKHLENINDYLIEFGEETKAIARMYNQDKLNEKIKFSGLLGRYMREIKNASAEVLQK